jgi:hypothetical protein
VHRYKMREPVISYLSRVAISSKPRKGERVQSKQYHHVMQKHHELQRLHCLVQQLAYTQSAKQTISSCTAEASRVLLVFINRVQGS